MANYQSLISNIQNNINANGNNEITGTLLQNVLVSMITALGAGYQFVGIATPATNPSTPDERVFMLGSSGTYPNFGPAEIPSGNLGVFYYDGSGWHYGAIAFPIGDGSITKAKLAQSLLEELLSGYVYGGVATIEGNPGTPERDCFYLTIAAGTYPNYGNLTVAMGELAILLFSTTNGWSKESIPISTLFQIVNNLTDGGTDKALSAEMGKALKDMIGDIGFQFQELDLDTYTTQRCSIGMDGKWYYDNGQSHKAIPVTPGDELRLTVLSTQGGQSFYAWLGSSYSPPYNNGDTVPYATGGRNTLAVGSSITVNAPAGAAYLVIVIVDGAGYTATWKVEKIVGNSQTIAERLDDIDDSLQDIDTVINGESGETQVNWGVGIIANGNRYYRVMSKTAKAGDLISFKLSNYTNYDCAIAVTTSPNYSEGTIISDTTWQNSDILKTINSAEDGYYVRAVIRKKNNSSITTSEGDAAIAELKTTRIGPANGLIDRVAALEDEVPPIAVPFKNIGTLNYHGKKIDLATFSYSFEQIGSLYAGVSSRQGGAVYGNYFFQFHNTLATVVVFRIDTGQNVQTINLTARPYCHAGSGGFSNVFYNQSDPFPLLYISSMDEYKIYVFRITGTEGAFNMQLVQTISLLVDFFIPNIAIDAPNGRGVLFGYTKDSWSNPSGNESVICCFDLPNANVSEVTQKNFYHEYKLPFIYAQQGACARFGKLYLSFGNTTEGLATGGIIVIDYPLKNVDSYLDLKPLSVSNFEPEAIGIWDDGLIVSEANGGLYKLTF